MKGAKTILAATGKRIVQKLTDRGEKVWMASKAAADTLQTEDK
jgi:hypothetical protein